MSNIEPITPTLGAGHGSQLDGANVGTSAPVENPGALLDRDAFLKLLVAQLKYQDPTKPADTSQMVTQSAQLTMVDRMNDIALALDDAASSDRLALAGALVGRDVAFFDDAGAQITARVDAVRLDRGELTVLAGGYVVPLGAVTQVVAPAIPVPAPPDPP